MNFMVGRGNGKTQMAMAEFVLNQAHACPICKCKPLMNWDPIAREIRLRCPDKCFADIKYRTEVFTYDPVELLCKAVDYWNQQVDEAVENMQIVEIGLNELLKLDQMKGDNFNG